ncbi:MAG TPA: class I SAM-dependent methyltransferase [Acidimicrobiales bacterium]|nr:class I SAM-dependent methyltransferase [Acidimicrobiales bacterium]
MSPSEYPYPDDLRPEMLPYVPIGAGRLLDVGCGRGGFGAALKDRDPRLEVWGVETSASACEIARERLDHVVHGRFPDALDEGTPRFGCVVFNDVLEHLEEPGDALARTHRLLDAGGVVVASIPNVRDLRVVFPLVVLGRWEYSDIGLLDRTHLRFFTRSSMLALFAGAGYRVERIDAINLGLSERLPAASRRVERLLGRSLNAFRTPQYAIVARPDGTHPTVRPGP